MPTWKRKVYRGRPELTSDSSGLLSTFSHKVPTKLILITIGLCSIYFLHNQFNVRRHGSEKENTFQSRHLLSTVEWEMCSFEVGHPRNHSIPTSEWYTPTKAYGWVALYVIIVLIVFVALALICDDFFVPSLEAISESLDLSEDVAGATFMAAGSSAPELFTSIAGVAVESDVGVGTIVGSAVFNLLGIVALSAAFAGQVLHLDWRPLARDATFYGLSVSMFIIFAWDGIFYFYESLIMLLLYFVYITIMKFNPRLMDFLSKLRKPQISPVHYEMEQNKTDVEKLQSPTQEKTTQDDTGEGENAGRRFSHVKKGELTGALAHGKHHDSSHEPAHGENNNGPSVAHSNHSVYDDEPTIVVCPCLPPIVAEFPFRDGTGWLANLQYGMSCVLFIISFPFLILFTWTIPNCSRPETRKYFLLSFIMSIVWIAVLSFAMVTLVGRTGCILGIDKFTMGLVVVAIGTSIPDALSSILVARDGYGDMAVSNAIGSNVFDVDLGIGLPFVISILIKNMKPIMLLSPEEQAMFEAGEFLVVPHAKFGFLLLLILFLALVVFIISGFKMTKKLGIVFVCMYFCFVAYAYIQDLLCTHNC